MTNDRFFARRLSDRDVETGAGRGQRLADARGGVSSPPPGGYQIVTEAAEAAQVVVWGMNKGY
jgi:hypothetical protein